MSTTVFIVFLAASATLAICAVLIFHPEYHDGLVRRIALSMLGIASGIRIMDILQNGFEHRPFSKTALLVWLGLMIFLADHFYNFMRHLYQSRKRARRSTDKESKNAAVA